jgi:peptidoglycan/LPS O-acetylase OafA/YrhL
MRGVAALTVLAGHLLYFSHPLGGSLQILGGWLGRFGVVVFFGISGFLIYRPFIAARHTHRSVAYMTPSYLWRRAVRILPAYWVALTLLAIWPGVPGVFSANWWVYYDLLQVYQLQWSVEGLQTAWTLCVEVTFYLALPFLAALLASRGAGSGRPAALRWEIAFLVPLAAMSIAVYGLTRADPSNVFLAGTLVGTFSWFVWGMLLAVIQVEHPDATSSLARFLGRPEVCWPLGIAVFALMPLKVLPKLGLGLGLYEAGQVFLLGLAATLLLAPAMLADGKRVVRTVMANRAIVYAGTISYGIYLYHYPVMRWFLEADFVIDKPHPLLIASALALAACIALGSASWYLVERPLMRRARSVKALVAARPGRERRTALVAPSESSG